MEPLITMTLSHHDKLQKEIDRLKKESIRNFIDQEYKDLKTDDYEIYIKGDKIVRFVKENYPGKQIYMKNV